VALLTFKPFCGFTKISIDYVHPFLVQRDLRVKVYIFTFFRPKLQALLRAAVQRKFHFVMPAALSPLSVPPVVTSAGELSP
jgi:phosphoenolpyruvate-protein kinase (PTS system EI component)